jgi:HK97 family phage major capsid protein
MPDITPELQAALDKIGELTETVKAQGLQNIDYEAITADFKKALEDHRIALLDAMPARAGDFQSSPVQRAVEGYGGKYKSELRDIASKGFSKFGTWKLTAADLFLAKTLLEGAMRQKEAGHSFKGSEKVAPPSPDLVNAVKALTSTGAGTGDELVPTMMASSLWQDFFAASRVAADLPNIPMPSDPFDLPLSLGDVTWRKGTQNTAPTASDPATAKSTLTSTEQVAEVDWSYNLDEDAVVAMIPTLRQRLSLSGGEAMDAFCLNADATNAGTGNINLDDADPADDSYYLSDGQDGIRHLAIVDNTGQWSAAGAALSDAVLTTGLALLDKYGLDTANCRIVPCVKEYLAMLGLTNVATVDKYGLGATILNGELARYRGIPVLPSVSVPKTEADGKVSTTAGNNTKGQVVMYNRNSWQVGYRRGLLVEVDRLIQKRQLVMVVSFRIAIGAYGTRSTADHTVVIGNIT